MIKTNTKQLQLICPYSGDPAVFIDKPDTNEFVEKTTSVTVNSSLRELEVEFEDDQEVVFWLFVNLIFDLIYFSINFRAIKNHC